MNTGAFLTCLGYFGGLAGAATALEGVYSPSSGTTGIFYNQLYSTGSHFVNNVLYSLAKPLVNVGGPSVTNNTFSGNNCYRAGYVHSGNYGILLDIEYSGCVQPAANSGKGVILLSTVDTYSGLSSGFMVGINNVNRLYFKTLNKSYTLGNELSTRDFIFVSLTENQYVDFGIYKPVEKKFYVKNVDVGSPVLNTSNIYVGNFLHNPVPTIYTGFSGKINTILLFNDNISENDVGYCSECSIVTGYQTYAITQNFTGKRITGISFSGVQVLQTTGYGNAVGYIEKTDGSQLSIIYPSGMTGYVQTNTIATVMLDNVALSVVNSGYNFLYDSGVVDKLTSFSITFNQSLVSGDEVEVYTYPKFNANIGKKINKLSWPSESKVIQLIGNGLAETLNVDYSIENSEIKGFFEDDILIYDVLDYPTIVTAYSGNWASSRIASGAGFFPPSPQYLEFGSAGEIYINSNNNDSNYDLYMNGQKLISGIHYNVSFPYPLLKKTTLSGFSLPQLLIYPLYNQNGELTGVSDIIDSELTFIHQFSGFSSKLYNIVSSTYSINNITGYSQQVWVNGIRQSQGNDYILSYPCNYSNQIINTPELLVTAYNSSSDSIGLWNFF